MTKLNPLIFRAYDIRGIAGKDLTPQTMRQIGRASGVYMREKYSARNLVIGRDGRISGQKLEKAFIEGLLESGQNVTSLGAVTSPMAYWATCFYGYDGGAAITASHNPKEYNGIKLFDKHARPICGNELQEIFKMADSPALPALAGGRPVILNIFNDYKQDICSRIHLEKPLKVAVDCGNGIAGPFVPEIFRALGCEVIELYTDVDGNFPNHIANPENEKYLDDLQKKVVRERADIGFGFDGDGDRIGIIDEKGKFYNADFILILLARDLFTRHPGGKVVFDIKTSKIVENEIKRLGGTPIRYKTGHSFTKSKMNSSGALLAGECSGHICIKENYYGFDDAIFAGAKILEILSRSSRPLSEHFTDLPKLYTTPEIKVPCPDESKFQIVEKLTRDFQEDDNENNGLRRQKVITIDGAFVEFSDTNWGAIRASNTTPCLTLRFEAKTPETLEKIQDLFAEKMRRYPEIDQSWRN